MAARKKNAINPSHYQRSVRPSTTCPVEEELPLQAVDVIEAFAHDNSHRAHMLTYGLRAGSKEDEIEDLTKCAWWILRELEFKGALEPALKELLSVFAPDVKM